MKVKEFKISSLYFINFIVVLSFALTKHFMSSSLNIWFIFLVGLFLSGFETIFFYKRSNKSFKPLPTNDIVDICLKSVGATVSIVGSIILVLIILNSFI
ncbi:MAG: hypothetical protein Q4P34_01745 [Tissierellia bacterium]|nr:hypothetical protein [Tissierellia bacterium]